MRVSRASLAIAMMMAIVIVVLGASLAAAQEGVTITVTPATASTFDNLSPTLGTTDGGTTVTITGTGLSGPDSVTFDGDLATIEGSTNTTITVTTPANPAGVVTVEVTMPSGAVGIFTNGFTYIAPATFSGRSPASGPTGGGTTVTISGTNLSGALSVQFDGLTASITSNSSTQIVVETPAHAAGTVNVVVDMPVDPDGTFVFTYIAPVFTPPPGEASPPPFAGPEAAVEEAEQSLGESGVLEEGESLEDALVDDFAGFLDDIQQADALDDLATVIVADIATTATVVEQALAADAFADLVAGFVATETIDDAGTADVVAALVVPLLAQNALAGLIDELAAQNVLDEVVQAVERQIVGAALLSDSIDIATAPTVIVVDEQTGEETESIQSASADGAIVASIPLSTVAAAGVATWTTVIEPVDDLAVLTQNIPIPGLFAVVEEGSGEAQPEILQAFVIAMQDETGAAITEFADEVTFNVQLDIDDADLQAISVFFFDTNLGDWVQIPALVTADGRVIWSTTHLTLFSVLRLRTVTYSLLPGR